MGRISQSLGSGSPPHLLMAHLRLEEVSCSFERDHPAVDGLSLSVGEGEFFCLIGPSGCGKSTLLRLIGGYLAPSAGKILMADREITPLPPEARNTGMVFQNYALFPHLTALENVAFGLRVRGVGKAERQKRASEMLDWVGLTAQERLRHPAQLSGGQQQRVALARALAVRPVLLMLDEPFANLDRVLRERLREELKQIQRESGTTTILVTHDREEAFALADRVAIMHRGKLLQTGAPQDLFEKPVNAFVADFLGHRNLLPISEINPTTLVAAGSVFSKKQLSAERGDVLLLRPERLLFSNRGELSGVILQKRFAGTHTAFQIELEGGAKIEVQRADTDKTPEVGEKIRLDFAENAAIVVSGIEKPA